MNITGIRPYEAVGFYANRIENADLSVKSVNIEPGEYLNGGSEAGSFSGESSPYLNGRAVQQNETSYDFAQKYDPTARYELKGSESDLASLDYLNEVPKAHKDEVLKQYQMFVGNRSEEKVQQDVQDSSRMLENFTL